MNSIQKIAVTGYNYANSNLYAKLLKFAKFKSDDQYFGESSRFIIKLSVIANDYSDTCEVYVATGRDYEFKKNYCTLNYLTKSNIKLFVEETDDSYILYVCSNKYKTRILAQVIYAENISMVDTFNFSSFDYNKDNIVNKLEFEHEKLKMATPNTFKSTMTVEPNKYIPFAKIKLIGNMPGFNVGMELIQSSNANTEFSAGKIYIKAKVQDDNIKFEMEKVYGTDDFNINNLNIIAVKTTWENSWTLYLEIKKAYTAYVVKPTIYNIESNDVEFTFNEKGEILDSLPDGAQTILFLE